MPGCMMSSGRFGRPRRAVVACATGAAVVAARGARCVVVRAERGRGGVGVRAVLLLPLGRRRPAVVAIARVVKTFHSGHGVPFTGCITQIVQQNVAA